jgi:hypothetical protein
MRQSTRQPCRGSVIVYILITIFLLGMLIFSLTSGPKKSIVSQHIDENFSALSSDISVIESSINDCVLFYSKKVDSDGDGVDDNNNPNIPYPLYPPLLTSGGAGTSLTGILCPGAPPAKQKVFDNKAGHSFRVLANTSLYTLNYLTDTTEGVLVRVTRASADPIWAETIARLDSKYSDCKAAALTAAGTCVNGCFYYWILRRATSVTAPEAGCP